MTEGTAGSGHSEQYFGDYRNFWWNRGFLNLMARRLNLSQHYSLLDVGCGQCHWSRLLVPYLGKPAYVTGVDNDTKWIADNPEIRAYFHQQGAAFELVEGNAQALPFADGSFDLVTCQTLLIHVPNPQKAIEEMYRVLKPGGTLLCVEPNNLVQTLIKSSYSASDDIEEVLDHVKYALICERGKKRLGEGDNSVGDLVPGMMARAGLQDIEVRLSDKAIPMYPPYSTREQQAALRQWSRGSSWQGPRHSDYDFFGAFGDRYMDFYREYQARYGSSSQQVQEAIREQEYHSAGGALMYLVSGVKNIE
jgi:SAM-dependent methyltransferase